MCCCCRHLDRHLDADEAVVLGAGLFAANLSSSFRLRVSCLLVWLVLDNFSEHSVLNCDAQACMLWRGGAHVVASMRSGAPYQ